MTQTKYKQNLVILNKLNKYEKEKNKIWQGLSNEERDQKEAYAKSLREKAWENAGVDTKRKSDRNSF